MCNVVYRFVNTEKIHAKYKAAIEVDIHGASGTKLIYQVSVTGGARFKNCRSWCVSKGQA